MIAIVTPDVANGDALGPGAGGGGGKGARWSANSERAAGAVAIEFHIFEWGMRRHASPSVA